MDDTFFQFNPAILDLSTLRYQVFLLVAHLTALGCFAPEFPAGRFGFQVIQIR